MLLNSTFCSDTNISRIEIFSAIFVMKLGKEIRTADIRTIFKFCRIFSLNIYSSIIWRYQCSLYINRKWKDQANQRTFHAHDLCFHISRGENSHLRAWEGLILSFIEGFTLYSENYREVHRTICNSLLWICLLKCVHIYFYYCNVNNKTYQILTSLNNINTLIMLHGLFMLILSLKERWHTTHSEEAYTIRKG